HVYCNQDRGLLYVFYPFSASLPENQQFHFHVAYNKLGECNIYGDSSISFKSPYGQGISSSRRVNIRKNRLLVRCTFGKNGYEAKLSDLIRNELNGPRPIYRRTSGNISAHPLPAEKVLDITSTKSDKAQLIPR
ncbi:hypothetical protein L9F63_009523, partial [Diploptera punctata]